MYTKHLKAFVSPLFYMTLENRCLETAYMLSEKKNLCAEQTAALSTSGLWECGCLGGGKEAKREGDY